MEHESEQVTTKIEKSCAQGAPGLIGCRICKANGAVGDYRRVVNVCGIPQQYAERKPVEVGGMWIMESDGKTKRQPGDMTVSEVARELHVRREHVIAFMRNGDLDGYDVTQPGAKRNAYRITRAAVDMFKQRRSVKQSTPQHTRRKRPVLTGGQEFF